MQFIGQKVEVRYLPDDMDNAYIYYENDKYYIRKTNKVENGKTKRNNPFPIDYSKDGAKNV
jgi:putative transposase